MHQHFLKPETFQWKRLNLIIVLEKYVQENLSPRIGISLKNGVFVLVKMLRYLTLDDELLTNISMVFICCSLRSTNHKTYFSFALGHIQTRVIYYRVWNRKNYFEIPAFLPIERGISRAGKFKIQSNVTLRSNWDVFVCVFVFIWISHSLLKFLVRNSKRR